MIRPARPEEAQRLTDLALRSKRSWGYSDAFMARAVAEMTIRPSDIEADTVEALELDGEVAGFYRLVRRPSTAWLEDLFIEPAWIGRGWGRCLLRRACEVGRLWGVPVLELVSDPNAEPFYRRCGAARVAMVGSPIEPGRRLPVMRLSLRGGLTPACLAGADLRP